VWGEGASDLWGHLENEDAARLEAIRKRLRGEVSPALEEDVSAYALVDLAEKNLISNQSFAPPPCCKVRELCNALPNPRDFADAASEGAT